MRWLCTSLTGLALLGGGLGCHHAAPGADCGCGGEGGPAPAMAAPVPLKPVPAPSAPPAHTMQPVPATQQFQGA
jgi:hypothetical protein